MTETRNAFIERIAKFLESHGSDEGGYSDAERREFGADAQRLRLVGMQIAGSLKGRRVVVSLPGIAERFATIASHPQKLDAISLRYDGRGTLQTVHPKFIRFADDAAAPTPGETRHGQ